MFFTTLYIYIYIYTCISILDASRCPQKRSNITYRLAFVAFRIDMDAYSTPFHHLYPSSTKIRNLCILSLSSTLSLQLQKVEMFLAVYILISVSPDSLVWPLQNVPREGHPEATKLAHDYPTLLNRRMKTCKINRPLQDGIEIPPQEMT